MCVCRYIKKKRKKHTGNHRVTHMLEQQNTCIVLPNYLPTPVFNLVIIAVHSLDMTQPCTTYKSIILQTTISCSTCHKPWACNASNGYATARMCFSRFLRPTSAR